MTHAQTQLKRKKKNQTGFFQRLSSQNSLFVNFK